MTIRKGNIGLKLRTPAYVCRETGAAELEISPETWDQWVRDGRLPPRAPGFPESTPRWRWTDVDRRLTGKPDNEADAFVARAGNLVRHGQKKESRRAAA